MHLLTLGSGIRTKRHMRDSGARRVPAVVTGTYPHKPSQGVDVYFAVYDQGSRIKLPMHELAAYAAFSKRMLERPAVRKVRGLEENILKGSNAWDGPYYAQPRRA